MSIETNLQQLLARIRAAEQQYGRPPHSVELLAVSKLQPAASIAAANAAGQTQFAENYLQEALDKMQQLSSLSLTWHFIGSIQTNKTRKIAEHFHWVQSVSSEKIAQRLNDQRPATLAPLNICLEVNIDAEDSKSGSAPDAILALATACAQLPRLRLRGLMCIPSPQTDFAQQRASFHHVYQLFQMLIAHGFPLDTLSMGMSNDFVAAIAEKTTLVRIGTALFGARIGR
jgi:PLP dependent protein